MADAGETILKVWIEPGCIVCNACESNCPEVFHVEVESSTIRPEALNVEGEEFGAERIMETLKSISTLSADQIRDVVARRVKDWCAGSSLYDDLTFVVMKVK